MSIAPFGRVPNVVVYCCDGCGLCVALPSEHPIPARWFYWEPGFSETEAEAVHLCSLSCAMLAAQKGIVK